MINYLIQILLPLAGNDGKPFPDETLRGIHRELSDRFGGLTAFSRAPAKGIWRSGRTEARDDIVIVEVMAADLEEEWWADFRKRTETLLRQDKLIVRAHEIRTL